jgi:hypothetical protein
VAEAAAAVDDEAAAVDVEAATVDDVDGEEAEVGAGGDDEGLAGVARRMSLRWPWYQFLVSSSISSMLPPPIRNAKSVFLFFAAAVVFSRAIRAPWLASIALHLPSNLSALPVACVLASAMHLSNDA